MSDSRPAPLPADLNARLAEGAGASESVGTANLAIAAAKLVAGLISGSAAMMPEAAHSLADTTTSARPRCSSPPRWTSPTTRPAPTSRTPRTRPSAGYGPRYRGIRYVFLDPTRRRG